MVYLTLQKNHSLEKTYCRTVAIQKCGGAPYELALRFAGCCLHCGACFASGYSWPEKFIHNKRVRGNITPQQVADEFSQIPYPKGYKNYNWLRILGGEPLLNDEYIEFLFEVLLRITAIDSRKFNNGIIIQTNGMHIGKGNLASLEQWLVKLHNENPDLVIAIETSIKGSNPEEFMQITQQDKPDGFHWNIQSYFNLKKLGISNLRPVVIAGYGVNESYLLKKGLTNDRITIIHQGKPCYHPSLWAEEFIRLYNDFTSSYVSLDPMFARMPMYGLKDQYEYAWAKAALKQGKQIYNVLWYDAKYAKQRDDLIESMFVDILSKFFLVDNQRYYSTLIKPLWLSASPHSGQGQVARE
jgi:uncharacterized Fe-S cluster-containing radical SAM superfamily protein